MRTLSFVPLCGLLLSLVYSGCDSASPDSERPALIPSLAVGDAWVMERTTQAGQGPETTRPDTFRVVMDTLIAGETWYHIANREGHGVSYGPIDRSSNLYAVREDGLWRRLTDGTARHVVAFPAEAGSTRPLDEGIASSLVVPDDAYTLEGVGPVATRQYRLTYDRRYRPYGPDSDAWYAGFALSGQATTEARYSPGYGFVVIEALLIAPNSERQEWDVVGKERWELRAFIPGAADR